MAARKGHAKAGGRQKGTPNKSTTAAREAIAAFVDNNAGRLQEWLDRVAEKDPEKAFSMFANLCEYHIPKLARTEHTGANGEPMQFVVTKGHVRGL